jgi:hypothetical protein
MFRAAHHSSSGALTVFAASGLHTHVVTGLSQVSVGTQFPLRYPHETLSILRQKLLYTHVKNTRNETSNFSGVYLRRFLLFLIHLKIGTAPSSETLCGFQPETMDNDQNFSHNYEHIAFSKSFKVENHSPSIHYRDVNRMNLPFAWVKI